MKVKIKMKGDPSELKSLSPGFKNLANNILNKAKDVKKKKKLFKPAS